MPEHLRALIVILFLASGFFTFVKRSACAIVDEGDFSRRKNLWFGLTFAAFLSQSFWTYTLITMLLLIYLNKREYNPPALFFSLMFVLPVATIEIPGLGLVNFLFDLSHLRILSLFILLPVFFSLLRENGSASFMRSKSDKALIAYLALTIILTFIREPSLTNSLRQTFYTFIDIFLPYFVISRSLKNLKSFRDAFLSLFLAITVLAVFAVFESYKHWLLYPSVLEILGLQEGMTGYLGRDGMLRVSVSAGQPIVLGYLMVVGIGLFLFLQKLILQNFIRRSNFAFLIAGLIAPLSRGPWMGAAALFLVFIVTGHKPARTLMRLVLFVIFVLPFFSLLPIGERVVNLLPFIGSTEKENIDYRENLITNSIIVIQRNPLFGSNNFLNTPEMESMRQGQGIIDIVNSYIAVTLKTGLVGLSLFVGFFVITLNAIYRSMRSIKNKDNEEYLLGRILLSTLLACLLIIFTVSSITFVPIVYWSIAGMGVAYSQMMKKDNLHRLERT